MDTNEAAALWSGVAAFGLGDGYDIGASQWCRTKINPIVGQKKIDARWKAKAESESAGLSFQEEIMRQIMGG